MDIPQQNHGGVVYCCRQCCKTPLFDHHANNLGGRVSRKVFWGENVSEASLWLLPFLSWVYNHNRKTAELSVHCNLHFNCCHTNRVTMTGPFLLAIFLFLLGFSPQSQKKHTGGDSVACRLSLEPVPMSNQFYYSLQKAEFPATITHSFYFLQISFLQSCSESANKDYGQLSGSKGLYWIKFSIKDCQSGFNWPDTCWKMNVTTVWRFDFDLEQQLLFVFITYYVNMYCMAYMSKSSEKWQLYLFLFKQ